MKKFERTRTRFAPSPTGFMHVGNLRTALYAFLIARKNNGDFIVRLEDTDQERKIEEAVDFIFDTLEHAGITHDESPRKGGAYGPYIQSERLSVYKKYVEKLLETGHAYRCFCDRNRLERLKKEAREKDGPRLYDGHCRNLTEEEIRKNIEEGNPYVIRQHIPKEGTTSFHDEVFGDISIENSTMDDHILMKTDGFPTYNFANVVDDHLMKISHVVRGSEYLISTPKYNLLYEAFGWKKPIYVHVSPVMRDKNRKLSKRDGDAGYHDFIEKGYLPEAVVNYIALLGWSPGDDREKFTMEELVEAFSIAGINKAPAVFDEDKLKWLNHQYIQAMTADEFHEHALPWIKKAVKSSNVNLPEVTKPLQRRTERFSDIPPQLDFLDLLPDYSTELYIHKKMKTNEENSLESLEFLLPLLKNISENEWSNEKLYFTIKEKSKEAEISRKKVLWALRVAISGKKSTPGGGTEIAVMIGKNETLRRIEKGIEKLKKQETGDENLI